MVWRVRVRAMSWRVSTRCESIPSNQGPARRSVIFFVGFEALSIEASRTVNVARSLASSTIAVCDPASRLRKIIRPAASVRRIGGQVAANGPSGRITVTARSANGLPCGSTNSSATGSPGAGISRTIDGGAWFASSRSSTDFESQIPSRAACTR